MKVTKKYIEKLIKEELEGIDEITAWWRETNETTPFTAEPKSLEERDGLLIVHAEVSGSFPGSPVMLGHYFALRDGKIESEEKRS